MVATIRVGAIRLRIIAAPTGRLTTPHVGNQAYGVCAKPYRHSDTLAGRVKFNECVRLLKWSRFIRIDAASSIDEVRTTLIELLCASAYDKLGVEATYTETLLKWSADRARGLAVDHARLLLRLLDPLHRVDDPFDTTTIHQPSTES